MVSQNSKILVVLNLGYSIRWVKVEELERRGCESRGVYDDKDDGCGGSLCSPGFESGIPQPAGACQFFIEEPTGLALQLQVGL